jgi:hypothetical protein
LVTEPFARSQSASATDEQVLRGIEVEARFEQQNDPAIAKYLAEDWVYVGPRCRPLACAIYKNRAGSDADRLKLTGLSPRPTFGCSFQL